MSENILFQKFDSNNYAFETINMITHKNKLRRGITRTSYFTKIRISEIVLKHDDSC